MKKVAVILSFCFIIVFSLFTFGCGESDTEDIKGFWKIANTDPVVAVVYTDKEFKHSADTWKYSLDTDKKIIKYEQTGEEGASTITGEGTYSFNDARNEFKVTQKDNATGEETTTTFIKISNDTNASPSVGEVE